MGIFLLKSKIVGEGARADSNSVGKTKRHTQAVCEIDEMTRRNRFVKRFDWFIQSRVQAIGLDSFIFVSSVSNQRVETKK